VIVTGETVLGLDTTTRKRKSPPGSTRTGGGPLSGGWAPQRS